MELDAKDVALLDHRAELARVIAGGNGLRRGRDAIRVREIREAVLGDAEKKF